MNDNFEKYIIKIYIHLKNNEKIERCPSKTQPQHNSKTCVHGIFKGKLKFIVAFKHTVINS